MTDSTMTEIPLVERLERLRKYLNGEGDIDGFWFGESADQDARPTFWWRKELPAITEAAAMLKAAVDALEKLSRHYPTTSETFSCQADGYASGWHEGVKSMQAAAKDTLDSLKQPASGPAS